MRLLKKKKRKKKAYLFGSLAYKSLPMTMILSHLLSLCSNPSVPSYHNSLSNSYQLLPITTASHTTSDPSKIYYIFPIPPVFPLESPNHKFS